MVCSFFFYKNKEQSSQYAMDREGTIQEVSNGRSLCTKKVHNGVDRWEQFKSTPVDHLVKKQRVDGSTDSLFDRLPEPILHDILSRLSILHLLMASRTCVAWRRIVLSCEIFQRFYDQKNDQENEESWIALRCPVNDGLYLLNINSNSCSILQARSEAWFLQGAADGLLLYLSRAGKFAVSNPLTGQLRLLPDTRVTSRLSLELSMKRKLSTRPQLNLSLNIVVDPADEKTFKVIVWGELRTGQVHLLVYTSATDTWTTKLCPEVDYKYFRQPFFSTVDGNTIYFVSKYWPALATYNTETDLFVFEHRAWRLRQWFTGMIVYRMRSVGIVAYKSQIFLIGLIFCRRVNVSYPSPLVSVGLWQGNSRDRQWELLTVKGLQFPSMEVVAAYDGKDSVTIVPSFGSVFILNLETKEWKTTSATPLGAVPVAPESSAWAINMKLKFRTAL